MSNEDAGECARCGVTYSPGDDTKEDVGVCLACDFAVLNECIEERDATIAALTARLAAAERVVEAAREVATWDAGPNGERMRRWFPKLHAALAALAGQKGAGE